MSDHEIRVGVHGVGGRMGRRIVALAHESDDLVVTAALEAAGSPFLGADAGELAGVGPIGVLVTAELELADDPAAPPPVDVVIDYSVPAAAVAVAQVCSTRKIALVSATTGLDDDQRNAVLESAQLTPIVVAPNTSLAVNLTMKLVREAARALANVSAGVDVEVIERHHRYKEDAPSGTALRFGQIVAEEMGQTEHVHGREGRPGKRPANEIGYHALRTGDNVGEHTIVFGLLGETIDLDVRGHSRDSYAQGALAAARFLDGKNPGLYDMADVLGL